MYFSGLVLGLIEIGACQANYHKYRVSKELEVMYKDKDKQREADRERQRRYRAERGRKAYPKGVTQGVTDSGRDKQGVTNTGCDGQGVTRFNTGEISRCPEMRDDKDVSAKPKRGKDIKTFADLPPAARLAIKELSDTDEEFKRRTAIAINYQHLFPDRYHSTGVA